MSRSSARASSCHSISTIPIWRSTTKSSCKTPRIGRKRSRRPQRLRKSAPPAGFHLGIQVRAVTDADVTPLALAKARGIVVVDVEKGGLAEKMGILPGDVILEVNNSEIGDAELFAQYVKSGAVKKFKVWRKGQALELTAPESL